MKTEPNWKLALPRIASPANAVLALVVAILCGFDGGCRRKAPKQDLSDINRPRPPAVSEPLTNVEFRTNFTVSTNR